MRLVIQSDIIKSGAPDLDGVACVIFDVLRGKTDWRAEAIDKLRREIRRDRKSVIFCSIPLACHIRRFAPDLAAHLCFDPEEARFSRFSSFIDHAILFNRDFLLLPAAHLRRQLPLVTQIFGGDLFIRPDSALKPFAGQRVDADDIDIFLSSARPAPDEICVVARAAPTPDVEHRTWLIDGRCVAAASYANDPSAMREMSAKPVPSLVLDAANSVAQEILPVSSAIVADFAVDPSDGAPRLVEMNSVSTSGLYPGCNLSSLSRALEDVFLLD